MTWKSRINQHLEWYLENAPCKRHGHWDSRCWISSLDIKTGKHPEYDHPEELGVRCYRWIESPEGTNLYWDLPLVQFVHEFGKKWGKADWVSSSEGYVRDYWDAAEAPCKLLYWGNHYYLLADTGEVMRFTGSVPPATFDHETCDGYYHELRPLAVDWTFLESLEPERAVHFAATAARRHLADPETGLFNRHAGHHHVCYAFMEAGALNAEAGAWAFAQTGDRSLAEIARVMLEYSWGHRDRGTGLIPVEPNLQRWDKTTATTETGFWVRRLFQTAEWLPDGDTWKQRAAEAMRCWLKAAWDPEAGQFLGRLDFHTGKKTSLAKDSLYQPDDYTDFWHPLFPRHDYPLQTATAAVDCAEVFPDEDFMFGVMRFVSALGESMKTLPDRPLYAEMAGRALHFLRRAEAITPEAASLREKLLEMIESRLWVGPAFRSHTGEDRTDAVDGLGFLFAALMEEEGIPLSTGLKSHF